jgi:hypothetical protein
LNVQHDDDDGNNNNNNNNIAQIHVPTNGLNKNQNCTDHQQEIEVGGKMSDILPQMGPRNVINNE